MTATPPQPAAHDGVASVRSFSVTGELPAGTTLLEASAGTGKTWTIASLVTRLVAEGHASLDQMLVVTFGRAASQELRERVREQLVAAARVLSPPGPPGGDDQVDPAPVDPRIRPLMGLLLAGRQDEIADRRARVRRALADFDSATIATTHQFCQLVLGSLGVAGDTDAAAHLVEDLDDLLVEVVDDLYVRGFARSGGEPVFDRPTALRIARASVADPQSRLEPADTADAVDASMARRRDFAAAVRAELDQRKRGLGMLSYDDLLSQLADALEPADAPARARMRGRWKVVLVDEFQDTDPVQWQVLDRAFSGVARMVLIGDPKQAIYAFRGGDVVTYLSAARTAGALATLDTNHRSDAPLLDAIQALLRGAALGDDQIVVREVRASHAGSRLVGAPHPSPFRLRVVDRARFGVTGERGVPIDLLRKHVANDLALDIQALLASGATFDGRPLQARDIAVLCETRKQCAAAEQGLSRHGIRSVVAGSGHVFATEAARDWLCLLEAMAQPHRSARVRSAALTPFFGRTATDLGTSGDGLTDTLANTVRDWAQLLKERGVAAVLEAASASGELATRVLGQVDGERALTDLRHIAEVLHEVAARERLGLGALISWMRQQMAQDRATVATERTRRLDSDAAAVQILTVHGSKGLQFPVVYLPSAADSFPVTPQMPLFHDDHGVRCIDVGGRASGPNLARALQEEAGEDLRLLYVALTRAQSQVVTWWVPSARNTTSSALHRVLFGRPPGHSQVPDSYPLLGDAAAWARAQVWQEAGGPVVELAEPAGLAGSLGNPQPGRLQVRRFDRVVDQDWRRTSYTSLTRATQTASDGSLPPTSEPEDPPRDDEPELGTTTAPAATVADLVSPMAELPVGATFGSLVHAVLEHADPEAPDRGGDWRAELLHHIDEQLVRWPVDLDRAVLADALVAVCDTPLGPLAATTLRQVRRTDRMAELDFELPLAGGDDRTAASCGATVRDLAAALRTHLGPGDPLRPFADTVDHPAYESQSLRGYLTGSLDLVMRVGGRYLVVDYKTNWLGEPGAGLTAAAYRPDRLAQAMSHSTYPLQALLYAVVLHRFLRWRLPGYSPAEHLGGVMYLYVRGMCGPSTPLVDGHPCGVFSWRPPVALVEAISDLLDGAAETAS
ncbi:MAG TPA: UvrD-helicase domain-containing protein [Dermatophilaceae bacterium]|nr:UvrD-helicase domain-containing protein [Dermatophilaceae bacterium]